MGFTILQKQQMRECTKVNHAITAKAVWTEEDNCSRQTPLSYKEKKRTGFIIVRKSRNNFTSSLSHSNYAISPESSRLRVFLPAAPVHQSASLLLFPQNR